MSAEASAAAYSASGVVIIDKPAGLTSHQVVARLRRVLQTRKIGHAGTLDPLATGVLVLGVNRATRLLGQLTLTTKAYAATICLGVATTTDDAAGEVIATADTGGLSEEQIYAAISQFRGRIQQIPAAVSAIKVNGKRAYAKVRAGETVTLPPRPVEIMKYEVANIRRSVSAGRQLLELDAEVECSSGTYIRSLARDLGSALKVGGHLGRLRRTRVGPFALAAAEQLPNLDDPPTAVTLIDMASVAAACFPTCTVDHETAQRLRYGQRIKLPVNAGGDPLAVLDAAGTLVALCRTDGSAIAVLG